MTQVYYNDYETEPVGGDNPYHRCIHCKRTDPIINGQLDGHFPNCKYRIDKERSLKSQQDITIKSS